jgi:hypothetical protein
MGHHITQKYSSMFSIVDATSSTKTTQAIYHLLKQALRFRAPNANLLAVSGTQHRKLAGQQALESGSTHPHDQTASNLYIFNL